MKYKSNTKFNFSKGKKPYFNSKNKLNYVNKVKKAYLARQKTFPLNFAEVKQPKLKPTVSKYNFGSRSSYQVPHEMKFKAPRLQSNFKKSLIKESKRTKAFKAHVHEVSKAFEEYDAAKARYKEQSEKFAAAAKEFKNEEEVSKRFQKKADMLKDHMGIDHGGKLTPSNIRMNAARFNMAAESLKDAWEGSKSYDNFEASPKAYRTLKQKQAARLADLRLKVDKDGNFVRDKKGFIKLDYTGTRSRDKDKKYRIYKNAMRRKLDFSADELMHVLAAYHTFFDSKKNVSSSEIIDKYESFVKKGEIEKGSYSQDDMQKLYNYIEKGYIVRPKKK